MSNPTTYFMNVETGTVMSFEEWYSIFEDQYAEIACVNNEDDDSEYANEQINLLFEEGNLIEVIKDGEGDWIEA